MSGLPGELDLSVLWGIKYVPGIWFNSVVKMPFLISDALVALLLFKVVFQLSGSRKAGEGAAVAWFLNPYLIWISSGWGMFDTLPALFTVGSFYFLLRNRFGFSALFLAIGVAYKAYPILFLVPVTFFFLRSKSIVKLHEALARFYLVFVGATAVLFFPALYLVTVFSSDLWIMTISGVVGEGLTYWSFALMLPMDIKLATLSSIAIGIILLASVCWKTCRLSFSSPFFELAAAQLALILVIYLSYRIILPQFFVWSLPFIIVLLAEGRVEELIYRASSLLALIYSLTACILPLFMLPMTPWIGGALVQSMRILQPFRVRADGLSGTVFTPTLSFGSAFLAALGACFSILMVVLLIESLYKPNQRLLTRHMPKTLNRLLCLLKIQVPA